MLVVFEKVCRSDLIIFSADKNDACLFTVCPQHVGSCALVSMLPTCGSPSSFIKAVLKELLHFFDCGHLLH